MGNYTGFTKATITWSVKQVVKMIEDDKMVFDNPVQRGQCWDKKKKSALIESIILGYPVPQIYAKKKETPDGNVYDILDGKQRLTSLYGFIHDEFFLSNNIPEIDGFNINGLRFAELPEDFQDLILSYTLSIVYFDSLTAKEEREIFKRLNGGRAITAKQLSIANCNNLDLLLNLGDKMILGEVLSKKSMVDKLFVPLLMKLHMIFNEDLDNVTYSGANFNDYIRTKELTEDDADKLGKYLDDVYEVFLYLDADEVIDFFTKETHFVSLSPFIKKMLENGMSYEDIAEKITAFLSSAYIDEYKAYCQNAVAKPNNIKGRHNALAKFFN